MKNIIEALTAIGLRKEEIQVYIALLEEGSASVLTISRLTKIPRATIYLLIQSLIKSGLVEKTALGKRERLVAKDPNKLLELAEEKKINLQKASEELITNMPDLLAFYNLKTKKPKIRYYEGVEGVKEIYEDSLSAREILVHCMTQTGIRIMKDYLEKYFKRILRRGIKTTELVSQTKEDQKYREKMTTPQNEIICIPNKYITNTDFFIYEDKIAMITYKGGVPVGILIEDKELANFERIHFQILFKAAKAGIL